MDTQVWIIPLGVCCVVYQIDCEGDLKTKRHVMSQGHQSLPFFKSLTQLDCRGSTGPYSLRLLVSFEKWYWGLDQGLCTCWIFCFVLFFLQGFAIARRQRQVDLCEFKASLVYKS